MKKIFIFIFCLFCSISFAIAKEYEDPILLYKDNYFIFGDNDDQVKFQISLQYNLIYPSKLGFFAGYTQKSFWKMYNKSAPFYETNYEPEIFYRFTSGNNVFGNIIIPFIDYIDNIISLSPKAKEAFEMLSSFELDSIIKNKDV